MKRNLDTTILQLDGSEFPDKTTLQTVCFIALTTPQKSDEIMPIEDKLSLYRLAQLVVKGGIVDFTAEEIALLKKRIGMVFYNVIIIGRAFDLLEINFLENAND